LFEENGYLKSLWEESYISQILKKTYIKVNESQSLDSGSSVGREKHVENQNRNC